MKKGISNPNICGPITQDNIEDILQHLPEKSLLRFKSVSKNWKSMLESSYLEMKRLARYPHAKLLVLRSEFSSDRSIRTIFLETISKDCQKQDKIVIHSHPFLDTESDYSDTFFLGYIVGYCDGFVCIYDYGSVYVINPATSKLRILPPMFLREYTDRAGWLRPDVRRVDFGRDIVTREFKLILMHLLDKSYFKIEVVNLNSNDRRFTSCNSIYNFNQFQEDAPSNFANGSLYWLIRTDHRNVDTPAKMIAMDLHTEKFRDVLLPNWYTEYSSEVYLWTLKDRLCLSDVQQFPSMDVWVLQREVPSVKWELFLSIDLSVSNINSLDETYWIIVLAGGSRENKFLKDLIHLRAVLYTENKVASIDQYPWSVLAQNVCRPKAF